MSGTYAMVAGLLHGKPTVKTTKSGRPVCFFKIKIPRGPTTEWWSCSVFTPTVREELDAFVDGDAICVMGCLNIELYVFGGKTRINRDLNVSRIMGIKTPDKARRDAEKSEIIEEIQSIDSSESNDTGGLPAWIARTTN
jgi:hypothetical protein